MCVDIDATGDRVFDDITWVHMRSQFASTDQPIAPSNNNNTQYLDAAFECVAITSPGDIVENVDVEALSTLR